MSDAPGILLDTSVLLAGVASPKGASYALLLLGQLGLIQVIVTPYILEEAERNLTKRLSNALPIFQQFQQQGRWKVIENPSESDIMHWAKIIRLKDVPILATAHQVRPFCLVTLDVRDFLANPAVMQSGLSIIPPSDLMMQIRATLNQFLGTAS